MPKTVDNDLPITDNCPGFGSVAKYVATSMREAAFDVASMAKTSTKVFVLEVMGRHAGWITAAVGMADDADDADPARAAVPGDPVRRGEVPRAGRGKTKAFGYCCVGVSEGLQDAQGKLMAEAGTRDAFGHAQLGGVGPLIASLVKDKLSYKYHWAVADYLQRAARHLASKTDVAQSYAVGKAAVEMRDRGTQRGDARDHARRPTSRTAGRSPRRRSPRSPTSRRCCRATSSPRDGYGITAKARAYLRPLMKGEDPPPFKDGLPQYVRLKNVAGAASSRPTFEGDEHA